MDLPEHGSALARWQALFKTPVAHSAVLFRRHLALEVGGYSEEFQYAEDYDLWSRLLKVTEIKSLSVPLVQYNLGVSGVSRAKSREQREVQCQIAARNMRDLIGDEVPSHVVWALAIGLDVRESFTDYSGFVSATTVCARLFDAFIKGTEASQVRGVVQDCNGRFSQTCKDAAISLAARAP